jgi:hypothetical protein
MLYTPIMCSCACLQEFTVRAVDLYVTNITVRVVPTEDDPAWLLDNIKIVNESNGNEAVFYHSNWLDHDTPSVNIWRNNPMVDYTVGGGPAF